MPTPPCAVAEPTVSTSVDGICGQLRSELPISTGSVEIAGISSPPGEECQLQRCLRCLASTCSCAHHLTYRTSQPNKHPRYIPHPRAAQHIVRGPDLDLRHLLPRHLLRLSVEHLGRAPEQVRIQAVELHIRDLHLHARLRAFTLRLALARARHHSLGDNRHLSTSRRQRGHTKLLQRIIVERDAQSPRVLRRIRR